MKTFRRMQHSMRANLPDVRDRAVIDEWEPKDPLPRFEALLREAGELDDERAAAIRARGRGAGRGGGRRPALADEDASVDDLLPAVFAPHRSYPAPPARGERELVVHGRDPRGARPRARRRPGRDRDGRGRRPRRRPLPGDRGSVRALRRRAHPRHAADRERLRRLRHRRRADRPAAGRRAPVLRLRRRRVRPDPQPGGEAAVHDGRHAEHAARAPDGRRAAASASARSTRRASRRCSRTSRGSSS